MKNRRTENVKTETDNFGGAFNAKNKTFNANAMATGIVGDSGDEAAYASGSHTMSGTEKNSRPTSRQQKTGGFDPLMPGL